MIQNPCSFTHTCMLETGICLFQEKAL